MSGMYPLTSDQSIEAWALEYVRLCSAHQRDDKEISVVQMLNDARKVVKFLTEGDFATPDEDLTIDQVEELISKKTVEMEARILTTVENSIKQAARASTRVNPQE